MDDLDLVLGETRLLIQQCSQLSPDPFAGERKVSGGETKQRVAKCYNISYV